MKSNNLRLSEKKDTKSVRKILLGIFVFTILLYSNSFKNNYAIDDDYVTVTNPKTHNNPRIEKGIKGVFKLFKSRYVQTADQNFDYRPLPLATFAIEYQFFGSNPHVSHFINTLIYALTCMLLFVILTKLFREYHIAFPLLVTALFMTHPIHTETVDNIKCRDELMAFLFGLCSTYFFIKNMDIGELKWKYIFPSILCLVLALLCKRTAILFFVFIPLTVWFFYTIPLKKYVQVLLLLAAAFIIYNLFFRGMLHNNVIEPKRDYNFFENPLYYNKYFIFRLLLSIYTCGYYLKLFLIPYPLCCYYGYNTIPALWGSLLTWVSLLGYITLGIYALIKLPQKNTLSYIILVFLLGIIPFSNFLKPAPGIVAERFVYFGSLGFCLLLAYGIFFLFRIDVKNKSSIVIKGNVKIIMACLLFLYVGITFARSANWKDELTLFRNDITYFQSSCQLHYMLGNKLYDIISSTPEGAERNALISECKSHFEQAGELMRIGIAKYPQDFTTLNNIGMVYMKIFDDAPAAASYFKQAFTLNPNEKMIQFNMALCYEKRNLPDSAILFYEKAIAANTNYLPVYLNLHELYIKKQAYKQAVNCDRKGISKIPNYSKLYINLGNAYLLNKDTLNAVTQYINGVNCQPSNIELRTKMEAFLISLKQKERINELNK